MAPTIPTQRDGIYWSSIDQFWTHFKTDPLASTETLACWVLYNNRNISEDTKWAWLTKVDQQISNYVLRMLALLFHISLPTKPKGQGKKLSTYIKGLTENISVKQLNINSPSSIDCQSTRFNMNVFLLNYFGSSAQINKQLQRTFRVCGMKY